MQRTPSGFGTRTQLDGKSQTRPSLRPYQVAAVQAASENRNSRPLLVAPTGSGKTTMGGAIVKACSDIGRRELWIAHRDELVEQAHERIHAMGGKADVRSIQSIHSGELARYDDVHLDEAHHYVSHQWRKKIEDRGDARLFGYTATPERGDGRGLDVFGFLHPVASIQELIEQKILVPCEVIRPNRELDSCRIAQSPLSFYETHARGKKAIVFCENVEEARKVATTFGPDAECVFGETDASKRAETIQRYREGAIRILCNVNVLTEGFDDPATDCVILARGCSTQGQLIQMVGRGLRSFPGKEKCIVGDLRGVTHRLGDPTADREYSLLGRGIQLKDREKAAASFCQVCGAVLTPGQPCEDCTYKREGRSVVVTGDQLERMEKFAYAMQASPLEKAAKWHMLMKEAKTKGYQWGWAFHRYKSTYQENPRPEWIAQARRAP